MKRILRYGLVLLCWMVAIQTTEAQDVVLTATSVKYPFQRGQWSEKQGEEWQQKYGPIIGVNCPYPPCSALSQEQAIALAASLGYNSVRWWPGGGTNADNYIKSVEEWAGWAHKYGMTVAPVFSFVDSFYGMTSKSQGLSLLEAQVRKIFQHFRNDDRIILWDVWNEPEMSKAEECEEKMQWIEKMALWGQQEGCTQPITSSIIWDSGVGNNTSTNALRTRREKTEALLDLHNYHDYSCQDGFNSETRTMVTRMRKMDKRPLVCTECMTRTNGSTYARTLYDFAYYHINFYTWGLYACDPNWEVRWGRSTFYNWEPMFHNLLYADGEPYDERDLPRISQFRFTDQNEDPGAEWTEQWTPRRAWRWMNRELSKGPIVDGIASATTFIATHANERKYTTIAVRIPYTTSAVNNLSSLLNTAESAGMTIVPILLTSKDSKMIAQRTDYVYQMIERYYYDRRVAGWCLYEQTTEGDEEAVASALPALFRKVRYNFANQPLMAVPFVTESCQPDSTDESLPNLMWRLSDVTGYEGDMLSEEWTRKLENAYHRPLLHFGAQGYEQSARPTDEEEQTSRWAAWKAWRWMSGTTTKGIAYSSLSNALKGLQEIEKAGTETPYNSLSVPIDYRNFAANKNSIFKDMDQILDIAGRMGMTVLPQLLSDSYLRMPQNMLIGYVEDFMKRYAEDSRIVAWDLYNKVCSSSNDVQKATTLLEALFETARKTGARQPIFATPTVTAKFPSADFEYIEALTHGSYDGWGRLQHGSGNIGLTYKIWCMSDVICYSSNQMAALTGWVNAQACKFGRPIFCAEWKPATSESPAKTLEIFKDMHVNWYVNGSLDAKSVKDFQYIPVSTQH